MKRIIIVLLMLLASDAYPVSEKETAYLINASLTVTIWKTRKIQCTKKVKERKKGRWVYLEKQSTCDEKYTEDIEIDVTHIMEAENKKSAREKFKKFCRDMKYKVNKINTVEEVK
jgi:hypothetical protein